MNADYLIAQIDQAAIVHNCNVLRSLAKPGAKLCVAIKANAYGHSIECVVPAMTLANVDMLAVAALREAQELRAMAWTKPILVLGSEFSAYSGVEQCEIAEWLIANDVRITLTRTQDADVLSAVAEKLARPAVVHVMLDSGMSRMGLNETDLLALIDTVTPNEHIVIEGLFTHFATADDADKSFAVKQLQRFKAFVNDVKTRGINIPIVHAANSPATVDLPDAHFDMIRPGVSVYGYHSSPEMHNKPDLKPSLRLITALTMVKAIPAGSKIGYGCTAVAQHDMLIGIVPVGYADGYDRRLSNRGKMIIANRVVPVIGRISMDQTIVDLTGVPEVRPGEQVIVIDNKGASPNSVEALCELLDTIPQVIGVALGQRVVRKAINE